MKPQRSRPALAILVGGTLVAVLDLASAIIPWLPSGVPPIRILQAVAAGLYGRESFQGGWSTALVGLACHVLIAFTWTTAFYLASRKLRVMTERPILSGVLYAEIVYGVMNYVVMPLSAIGRGPRYNWQHLISGPVGHVFFVGLPIALAVRHFAGPPRATAR
jgi:hypothetical protein